MLRTKPLKCLSGERKVESEFGNTQKHFSAHSFLGGV